jgi:hypothetical protein
MKKLFFSILLSVISLYSNGQSAVETEIKQLEQTEVTAILQKDTNTLKQIWAPEFFVNNPRNTISPNRDAVIEVMKGGLINYSQFERIVEQVYFQKDIVITMGQETFVSRTDIPGVKAGQTYKRRFTNIWMNKDGKWQQVARHASIICQ